jgi:cytochrome P450
MSISNFFQAWITSPPVLRTAFSILRKVQPVAIFGKTVIVTRYNDVKDVLKRDKEFTVHQIDGYKMEILGAPFVLGMDSSPEATHDKEALMMVIKREDLDWVRILIRKIGTDLIEKAKPNKQIDTVDEYARFGAAQLVAQYFGVPADEKTMMRWQRNIFDDAFVNLKNDPAIHEKGMIAGKEIVPYVANLIAERKKQTTTLEDNILNRLINKQKDIPWLDDDAVRRNILGVILGVVENTSKVVTQVIDQLLQRPELMETVKQAAIKGDMDTVRAYCFDILRFNPHNPVILRYCTNGAVIGAGTAHEKKIKPGSTIYAATISAMFDPEAVPNPKEIDPARKVDYLHFGHGTHQCTGRYITEVNVPELVAGLLRLPNLRRAPGKPGKLKYVDLVFPESLVLQFD